MVAGTGSCWSFTDWMAQDYYYRGDLLNIKVSKIGSRQTNMPYSYFDVLMQGLKTDKSSHWLSQEFWEASPYSIWLNPNDGITKCQVVQDEVSYEPAIYKRLKIMAS